MGERRSEISADPTVITEADIDWVAVTPGASCGPTPRHELMPTVRGLLIQPNGDYESASGEPIPDLVRGGKVINGIVEGGCIWAGRYPQRPRPRTPG